MYMYIYARVDDIDTLVDDQSWSAETVDGGRSRIKLQEWWMSLKHCKCTAKLVTIIIMSNIHGCMAAFLQKVKLLVAVIILTFGDSLAQEASYCILRNIFVEMYLEDWPGNIGKWEICQIVMWQLSMSASCVFYFLIHYM